MGTKVIHPKSRFRSIIVEHMTSFAASAVRLLFDRLGNGLGLDGMAV